MSPRTGDITTVVIPGRYPEWEEPPLPGGPPTPGGDRTVQSGVGLRTAALVGAGHRVPILYGRCLITPDIVRVAMANYRAEFTCILSEGPIDAVESWLTDLSNLDTLTVTLGTMSTPAYGLSGTIGLAAAYIMTKAGRPYQPRCIARGRKPYDPRLGAWGAGFYPDPTKCAYSTNPALIMADLKTFPQYGTGWPTVTPARVDWQSVEDAADYCDTLEGGLKRYELNLYVQLGKDGKLWEDAIGLHAGLRWREEGGLWYLDFSGPVATASDAITTDHLVADSSPRLVTAGGAGLLDRPNVFTAEWIDPLAGWITRTVTVRSAAVEAGTEAERPARVYKLHGFHTETMAHRALWRIAHEVWSEQTIELDLTTERLDLVEGSRVPVVLPSVGLSGEEYLVTKTTYDADIVRVTARRYDADTWTPVGGGENALTDPGFFDVPDDVTDASLGALEFDSVYSSPLFEARTSYLGISWEPPTFPYARRLLVKIADEVLGRPVLTLGVVVGGTGRSIGDPLTFVSSTGASATAHVSAVSGGVATAAVVDTPGTGYIPGDYARTGVGAGHAEFEILTFDLPDLNDAGWDAEEPVPLAGDTRFNASPALKWSLRPWTMGGSEHTYDTAGFQTLLDIIAHARTVLIRVESLAGLCSPGVCLIQQDGLSSSSSSPSTVLVKKDAATSPSDGDRAVWDASVGGVRFESGGGVLKAQEYTSGTTTWTAPAGVTEVWITGCGGGGGGGRGNGSSNGGGGGGGGADSVFRKRLSVTPATGYSVVVGGGGAGSTGAGNGGNGGESSFGALLTLAAGLGGSTSASATGVSGGTAGGPGGTNGTRGESYVATYETGAQGGFGGISFPGGYGAGGDGGATNQNGLAGNSGYILVEWNE